MRSEKDEARLVLDDLLEELDGVLKKPEVDAYLTENGINVSLALLIADGLRAYLKGQKKEAADDLGTAAEEIAARLGMSNKGTGPDTGSGGGKLLS
jgi:hypothetical protein